MKPYFWYALGSVADALRMATRLRAQGWRVDIRLATEQDRRRYNVADGWILLLN